jgi:hypothetical protein
MRRPLLVLTLFVLAGSAAAPAAAQARWATSHVAPSTAAPLTHHSTASSVPIVANRFALEEGFTYGMHNRPGTDADCFGSFDPTFPFDASCTEVYPQSAFAGTIAGDDLFYYVIQTDTTAAVDSLYAYDFNSASEVGEPIGITYFTVEGDEVPADSQLAVVPQWVDGGIDTDTGELILLGRAGACTVEQGAELWSVNLATGVANEILRFQDPDNCPLSGAYDDELGFFIGMVPGDGGASRVIQTDLTDGAELGSFTIPYGITECQIAAFIQAGATDFGRNLDPSDNAHWLFLFQGINPDLTSTAQLVTFDADGVVDGLLNFGEIDEASSWVEVLATGFPNIRPVPNSAEPAASPSAFAFVGVYPNPARTSATAMLRTSEGLTDVSVKVYDALGREVATLHDGPLAANTHHFGLAVTGLPPGLYVITARTGTTVESRRIVVLD